MEQVTTSGRRRHWPSAIARVIAAVGLVTGLLTLVTAGPAAAATTADISGSGMACTPTSPVTNPPFPGATVTCTVTIANAGAPTTESATDLGVVVTLPAGVTWASGGDSHTSTTVTFSSAATKSLNGVSVAPGGTTTASFTATIDTGGTKPAPGTALVFSAAISAKSNGTGSLTATKTSTVTTANDPAVIAITSYVCAPAAPLPGATVTCTATIGNTGGDATGINGTLSTPTNTTLVSGGTFTIATLAGGASTTKAVTGTVNTVAGGATINSTATVTTAGSAYGSPTTIPGLGTASNTLTVAVNADLDMTGTSSGPATANANQSLPALTDSFTVKNNGPDASNADVAVTFTASPLANTPTINSIFGAGTCTVADATHASCTGISLISGASAIIFVQFTAPPEPGSVSATATVTPHAGAPADPVGTNNTSAAVVTTVSGVANLTITGSTPGTQGTAAAPILLPAAGTAATLHFVVHNGGPSTATGVTATVTIPAGATYNGPGSGDFLCPGAAVGSVTCTLAGSLLSGADAVQDLNFTLTPLAAADSNQRVFNLSVSDAATLLGTHSGGTFTFFVENTPVVPAITLHAALGSGAMTYNVVTGAATNGSGTGTVTPDPDDPSSAFAVTATNPTHGTSAPATATAGVVTITYTPPAHGGGSGDSFTYTFSDGKGGTGTNTVTVQFDNIAPTTAEYDVVDPNPARNPAGAAQPLVVTVPRTTTTGGPGVFDPNDGDALTFVPGSVTVLSGDTTGTSTISAVNNTTRTFTYTPSAGVHGDVVVQYQVTDGTASPVTGTVKITVPDAPPVATTPFTFTTAPALTAPVTITLTSPSGANLRDPNGDTLTVALGTVTGCPTAGCVVLANATTGAVTLTVPATFHNTAATPIVVPYTASDAFGGTFTGELDIVVPDAPPVITTSPALATAAPAFFTGNDPSAARNPATATVNLDTAAGFNDPNSDTLTVAIVSVTGTSLINPSVNLATACAGMTANGTLPAGTCVSLDAGNNHQLDMQFPLDFVGTATVNYTVTDGASPPVPGVVKVFVPDANPVAVPVTGSFGTNTPGNITVIPPANDPNPVDAPNLVVDCVYASPGSCPATPTNSVTVPGGTFTINAGGKSIHFAPSSTSFKGTVGPVGFRVTDGHTPNAAICPSGLPCGTGDSTVTVTVTNSAPTLTTPISVPVPAPTNPTQLLTGSANLDTAANLVDANNDTITVTPGTATLPALDPGCTGTPTVSAPTSTAPHTITVGNIPACLVGTISVPYTASDGTDSVPGVVNFVVADALPVLSPNPVLLTSSAAAFTGPGATGPTILGTTTVDLTPSSSPLLTDANGPTDVLTVTNLVIVGTSTIGSTPVSLPSACTTLAAGAGVPAGKCVALDATNPHKLNFQFPADFVGTATASFTVTDLHGGSVVGTVTVTVPDAAPVIQALTLEVGTSTVDHPVTGTIAVTPGGTAGPNTFPAADPNPSDNATLQVTCVYATSTAGCPTTAIDTNGGGVSVPDVAKLTVQVAPHAGYKGTVSANYQVTDHAGGIAVTNSAVFTVDNASPVLTTAIGPTHIVTKAIPAATDPAAVLPPAVINLHVDGGLTDTNVDAADSPAINDVAALVFAPAPSNADLALPPVASGCTGPVTVSSSAPSPTGDLTITLTGIPACMVGDATVKFTVSDGNSGPPGAAGTVTGMATFHIADAAPVLSSAVLTTPQVAKAAGFTGGDPTQPLILASGSLNLDLPFPAAATVKALTDANGATDTLTIDPASVKVTGVSDLPAGSTATPVDLSTADCGGLPTAPKVCARVDTDFGNTSGNPHQLDFQFPAAFVGTAHVAFTVTDSHGVTVAGAPNSIDVIVPDSPPTAAPDNETTSTNGAITVQPTTFVKDANGDKFRITEVTAATKLGGQAVINKDDPTKIDYTAPQGVSDVDVVTYTLTDDRPATSIPSGSVTAQSLPAAPAPTVVTSTGQVLVTIADAPPAVFGDAVTVIENTPTQIFSHPTDPNTGQALIISGVSQGQHGTVTQSSQGLVVTYTPEKDYIGPDQFSYTVTDGTQNSNSASVAINVVPDPNAATSSTLGGTSSAAGSGATPAAGGAGAAGAIPKTGADILPYLDAGTGSLGMGFALLGLGARRRRRRPARRPTTSG